MKAHENASLLLSGYYILALELLRGSSGRCLEPAGVCVRARQDSALIAADKPNEMHDMHACVCECKASLFIQAHWHV